MGEVWEAKDTIAEIAVALKTIPREVSLDEGGMAEIKANFQLIRKLTHPNIVTLRALEQDPVSGRYYLVQDCIPGMNLGQYWRSKESKQLPVDEAIRIVGEIAKALDFAHDERVVHRDVKLENVMITPRGKILVLDFGIAMQIRETYTRLTREATDISGTPLTMAPEQWRGEPQDGRTGTRVAKASSRR